MIKINNLSKTIKQKKIIDNINAELKGITGIIGPNGAGKTTLMKILASIINGDKGTDIIYIGKNEKRVKIGYSPQNFSIYPNLTVLDVLKLLSNLNKVYDINRIEHVLKQLNLVKYKNTKMKNLSGGTIQRVGIAQALLSNPDFLIIDEPTAGLDILECIKLRNILLNISKEVEIIVSSHIPEDITFICEHILVINRGRKIFEGKINEIISISDNLVYEAIVKKDEVQWLQSIGLVLSNTQLSEEKIKVRILMKQPVEDERFTKVASDFLSGYITLLNGGERFD